MDSGRFPDTSPQWDLMIPPGSDDTEGGHILDICCGDQPEWDKRRQGRRDCFVSQRLR